MVTANLLYVEELEYSVSFRQVGRVDREDVPPPGRFETTNRVKLARTSRYSRQSGSSARGIHQRGTAKASY